ncbi:transposase family protein, partial [Rathayibacter iranicus]
SARLTRAAALSCKNLVTRLNSQKERPRMKHTTGMTREESQDLAERVLRHVSASGWAPDWPPILGLFGSLVVTLTYLRRNSAQVDLAERYGVSQSTISRAISSLTAWIAATLQDDVPTADDLDVNGQYIIDGTLLPCWSWANRPTLWSGKHSTTGVNIQVACDLSGRLAWISDPVDGHRHDNAALRASGVLEGMNPQNWFGDKGYIGLGIITPIRKNPDRDTLEWEHQFNKDVNSIRYHIERAIAHLKNW